MTLAALFLFLWWKRHTWLRASLFAFAYFVAALFPVLGLFTHYFLRYSFVGDHFQYLASMGPLALAGAGAATIFNRWNERGLWLRTVCYGSILALLGLLTSRQCAAFVDDETLWRRTLSLNSRAWIAENNLGTILMNQMKLDEALVHFENSSRIRPDHAAPRSNIGLARFKKGEVDEAISDFKAALAISPNESYAYAHLANALVSKGRAEEAIPNYRAMLLTNDLPEVHRQLGVALFRTGRVTEAIAEYETALRMEHPFREAYFDLAVALEREGELGKAVANYEEAIRYNSRHLAAQNNLAWLLATAPADAIRNGSRAVALAEEARRLTSGQNPAILDTLAAAYAEAGRFPEALEAAETALRLALKESDPAFIDGLRRRIELYRANAPFRAEPLGAALR